MEWNELSGVEWNGVSGVEWSEWSGVEWSGVEWVSGVGEWSACVTHSLLHPLTNSLNHLTHSLTY